MIGGWVTLVLALAPSLAAIAWVPEFSTQDGPAHLYSARILNASLGPNSPFAGTYAVAWQPLPNWMGQLATMACQAWLPSSLAARAVTALTLVLFSASVVWLRVAVAGPKGLATASRLAAVLGLNVTWLLGFTSFLLGASLFPATLALWWGGRDRFGPARAAGLAGLLVLGYFSHPIGLGLTVGGLGVLAWLTPGPDRWRRALLTALAGLPLIPLGLAYRAMTRSAGGLEPVWEHLNGPGLSRAWVAQLGWVDPISLAGKVFRPFGGTPSSLNGLLSPAAWTGLALVLLAGSTWAIRSRDRRGWLVLGVVLIACGMLGPDTLGVKHGHYLPQRVVLLGLVALVPWLDFATPRRSARLAAACLGFALLVQSAFVWDYALDCRARLGRFSGAARAIGSGHRIGTLLAGTRGRFRSNPLLHADCLFGVGADNVVWSNYETAHYYFPVKVRAGLEAPSPLDFERLNLLDGANAGPERARLWAELLEAHGDSIDVLVEWNATDDPALDSINARYYDPTYVNGPVRVWARRPASTTRVGGAP